MTPNEFYSHEIIDAANDALEIYRFCDEYPRFFDVQPDKEFAAFYYENASGKIYSKKRDLLRNSYQFEVETLGQYGLLCFELIIFDAILERDYSNGNYIHLDSLHKTLYQLAIDGDTLLKKYYNCLFYEGAMLSKEVLKKHLKENHKIGKEKIENMIDFSDWIRIMGSDNMIYYGNFEDVYSQVEDFRELEISPIRVSKWCPYIPSFADMLNGTVDDKLLSFAMQVTADKEGLTYWNFDEISKSGKK